MSFGLKSRERVLPNGTVDFEADISKPYMLFKIDADKSKVIDLSTVELTSYIDSNASIDYKNVAAPAAYPSIQQAQYSFHYPLGVSGFLGRIRLLTLGGVLIEEIQNVNVLAETRKVFLDREQSLYLARLEGRGVQTNLDAFQQNADYTDVTGNGNIAQGNGVLVSQLLQTKFRFGTLGGIFSKKLMTLKDGLMIEIYFAPFSNQRRLSGAYLEMEALKNMSLPATCTTAGELIIGEVYSSALSIYNFTNLFSSSKVMISYVSGGAYVERAAYIVGADFDPDTGIQTYEISPTYGGAAADLNPSLVGASEIYVTPVDAKTKLPFTSQPYTPYDATTASNIIVQQNMYAHGVAIQDMNQNGDADAVLYQNQWLKSNGALTEGVNDVFGVSRSGYQHLPLYSGRLCKIFTQNANYNASEYTIAKIDSIASANLNSTVTVTFDSNWNWTAAPNAVGDNPVGMICLMDETTDLQISGTPYLRQVQIEFETLVTSKPPPSADIEFSTWRTELFNLTAGQENPFLTLSTQVKNLEYIIIASMDGYSLKSLGLNDVMPLYNSRALFDAPIDIKFDEDQNERSSTQIWTIERSMGGIKVKQPNLFVESGLSFDYINSPIYQSKATTGAPPAPSEFITMSQTNFIVLPGDDLDTVAGRYQLQFGGTVDSNKTLYVFVKHKRDLSLRDGSITVL